MLSQRSRVWAGGIPTSSARRQTSTSTSGALLLELVEEPPFLFTEVARAGELNSDELERLVTIIQNPTQFKIPLWFLNRQRDIVDGKNSQILSNGVDSKLRDDLERLKKIRAHRGLRHFWGLRVRGQHTKTTGEWFCLSSKRNADLVYFYLGRRGKTVGVSKKRG